MSNISKLPYEISVWDDILVYNIRRFGSDKIETILPEDAKNITQDFEIVNQYYKEKKIAIIGSDIMSAPWRAHNPSFVKNVNGSLTLTFIMYSKFYDEDIDSFLDNPFTKLMVNERKVKLKYKGEWYDFIIKSIQESSDNKTYTYTAKSLFINELSKTGYNLVFDTELENNLGTIDYLADQILDGSDWKCKDGDIIRQYKEEPLYLIKVTAPFTATRMLNIPNEIGPETVRIEAGEYIYGFYQSVNYRSSMFQFLYRADLSYDKYPVDDDRIIINTPNYYMADAIDTSTGQFKCFDETTMTISDKFRGRRLVKNINTKYDPVSDKYVTVYKNKAGETIYGYTEYEYITSGTIKNYVTNPSNFTSTDGWKTDSEVGLKLITDPPLDKIDDINSDFKTYLQWDGSGCLINSCITENASIIKNFSEDEYYVIKFKYNSINKFNLLALITSNELNFYIAPYSYSNGKYEILKDKAIFYFERFTKETDDYWVATAKATRSVSYEELLKNNYSLILECKEPTSKIYCLEDVKFFKYVLTSDGKLIMPNTNITAETKTKYIYYKYDPNIKDANLIEPIYQGYKPSKDFIVEYDTDCEKKRSIKASESNRFNLIQTLCETFECWAKFEIEHNLDTGEILLDENYRQKKWISFHEYIGKDNYIGFKYGINLKSIQRTLDSDAIASKLIVKNNSNEYATDGFCTIARADENPTKENFLLDFSHYINQGLLNFSQFNNDLYNTASGYLGYYTKLKELNATIEEKSKLLSELVSKTLPQLRSQYSIRKVNLDSSNENFISQKEQIYQLTSKTLDQLLKNKEDDWWKEDSAYSLVISTLQLKKNIEEYEKQFAVFEKALNDAEEKQNQLNDELEEIVKLKEEEHSKFYKKYSRYIQEGAWTSEDYIDDNLYYLDAVSTLHTSSQPKVTYIINVIELSQIEGFELYDFGVGDKTFIEDTEFFGWTDSIHSTPYKEEVVVTEVRFSLDDPSQNTITVKNYKTQFEDLFQRITAITTSVQFSTGDYQRAANMVNADGTLDASAVQNSITNNSIILSNSSNESVIWDSNGITTTSLSRPNEMVRIVGGGIFLSKDFGTTWSTGITGEGINANYINAGQIDTNLVRVMNGSYPTFRWDSSGLSSYYFEQDAQGNLTNYSQSKFVRLDQYGLYGINNDSAFVTTEPDADGAVGEDKVEKYSKFYLTWSGFGIKTDSGAVSITSNNEFQVFANGKERIKIGTLDQNEKIYGMRLFDDNGKITLETGSNGQLYLQKTIKIAPSPYIDSSRTIVGPSVGYDKNNKIVDLDSNDISYSKIFSVNNIGGKETIAFYDNGLLEAYNAKIAGTLEAGSIISNEAHLGGTGGITIGDLSNNIQQNTNIIGAMKGIDIASSSGTIFKIDASGNVTPESITFEAKDKGVLITTGENVKWYLSNTLVGIDNAANHIGDGISITIKYSNIKSKFNNDQCYIYAKYTADDTKVYTAYRGLSLVRDGKPGVDGQNAISYKIDSSEGFVINSTDNNAPTITTLTARIYSGSTELDTAGKWTYTWYDKKETEVDFTTGGAIGTGKQIQYDLTKFNEYTQIYFTVNSNS